MKYLIEYSKLLFICLITAVLNSCSLNIPLEDEFTDPNAITDIPTARSLLTSIYSNYPHFEYVLSILGPDFAPSRLSGKDADSKNLYYWQGGAIIKQTEPIWEAYYNTIANCDVLLERAERISLSTAAEKRELENITAEAKTLKAMSYFDLLRMYAPAYDTNPEAKGIVIKTKIGVETKKRSTLKECTRYILSLLTEASTAKNHPTSQGWASQTAVWYLISEVSLYQGEYETAEKYARKVIATFTEGSLAQADFSSLWNEKQSPLRIFGFYLNAPFLSEIEYSKEEGDYFIINPQISYEERDRRRAASQTADPQNDKRFYLGKYNSANKSGKYAPYINKIRYANACFIAAEALAHQSGKAGEAIDIINKYLSINNCTAIQSTLTGEELIESILTEKEKEFIGEGVLFFDYKRLHKGLIRWNIEGNSIASTISPSDFRWTFPIPSSEYRFNEVDQNDNWPKN